MSVSTGHEQLTAAQFAGAVAHVDLWHDPAVAAQQRALVDDELARLRAGEDLAVFRVLRALVAEIDPAPASVLEVGCASGYYHEVLRQGGWAGRYLGVDCSAVLIDLARQHHPGGEFRVADACALGDVGPFDLVLSGACLMHVVDWRRGLAELARVARGHVLLHRTPLAAGGAATYWRKLAYGAPCAEQHFGEAELLAAVGAAGLRVAAQRDTGDHGEFVMRSYLCAKERA